MPPSFIFLDINMPALTGDVCLSVIRSCPEFDHVPIAIISTSMSCEDSKKYLSLGANFALAKPFRLQGYYDILKGIFSTSERAQ